MNSYQEGPIPLNMDSGTALGDLFFDLKFVLLKPFSCEDPFFAKDCKNPETQGSDLVINRLELEHTQSWGEYAYCNVGTDNGTDIYGHPCPKGQYCCLCGDPWQNDTRPCTAHVGRTNPRVDYPPPTFCNKSAPEWSCWRIKIAEKLNASHLLDPGWWYSTLDYGYCPLHPDSKTNCTWRVASVKKIVNKTCHANSFLGAVEAYNRSCFDACGPVRNVTDKCWVRCFYITVLGPDSGRAGGQVTGIDAHELLRAWKAPFDSDDPKKGGCVGLDPITDFDNFPHPTNSDFDLSETSMTVI